MKSSTLPSAVKSFLLLAVIGFILGFGFWWFNRNAASSISAQDENNARRAGVESVKPIMLDQDLPETDRELESVGDKLTEASFHIREQETPFAQDSLNEAAQIVNRVQDDSELAEYLTAGIKNAQNNLAQKKTDDAVREIKIMLDRLNMPEN